jgi:hypothetical protein
MMTLGCAMRADAVSDLLRTAREQGSRTGTPAMSFGQAHAIIRAVLWLHGVRGDSTSAAYALCALDYALTGADGFEMRRMQMALGLATSMADPTSSEAWAMRVALGLRHDPWSEERANGE